MPPNNFEGRFNVLLGERKLMRTLKRPKKIFALRYHVPQNVANCPSGVADQPLVERNETKTQAFVPSDGNFVQ